MTTRARVRKLAIRSILTAAGVAALIASGASASEAKGRRHWHRAHHHHHHATAAMASIGSSGSFSGQASYYGSESGSRTASGARFNPGGLTAAHRSLPFGTKLRVTHGGRSVIVTVNDRGPFVRGRVLDLSRGAAQAIGLTGRGVGHVVAEVL